jgi:23S rRNA (guanosine2251-2'-O)-methyltransferase
LAAGAASQARDVERRDLDNLLRGAVHQGIALEADPLPEMFLQDLLIRAESRPESLLVVLDQVTDPHNVGAVLRSAAAFGADGW